MVKDRVAKIDLIVEIIELGIVAVFAWGVYRVLANGIL